MRKPSDSCVLFSIVGVICFALLTCSFLGALAIGAMAADAVDSASYLTMAGQIGAADVAAGIWAVLGVASTQGSRA